MPAVHLAANQSLFAEQIRAQARVNLRADGGAFDGR
jgi:hypothetical protein